MKVSSMDVSPSAYELIDKFNQWLEASSKKEYRFTIEEQYALEKMIKVMDNQINILVDYETKKEQDKKQDE
jgi:hypothetical protein